MYPMQLQSAMYGFLNTAVLFACEQLGLLAKLSRSARPLTVVELADSASADPEQLTRLLDAASAIGIVEQIREGFRVPAALRPFLDPESDLYLGGFLDHLRNSTYTLASSLPELVRRRPKAAVQAFDTFVEIYRDEAKAQAFLNAMWNIGIGPARELVADPVIAGCRQLVDIGGGPGAFAVAAAERYEQLEAVVFDLSPVEPHFERRAAVSRAQGRLGFVVGNFWSDRFPPADVYVLGYVLSDWEMASCMTLLQRVFDALPPGGHVAVLEKLFDEGRKSPYSTVMLDMAMLLETGGGHRTYGEYECLLRRAGFDEVRLRRSNGEKHMIVAEKPAIT